MSGDPTCTDVMEIKYFFSLLTSADVSLVVS